MKIIKESKLITTVRYELMFDWDPRQPGSGFGFDCDEHGNVDVSTLPPAAAKNYRQALMGAVDGTPIYGPRIVRVEDVYREPAIGLCNRCLREVVLAGFTIACECGADYNSAGQQLAPRSQWGEETGETAADILMGVVSIESAQ